MKRITVLLLLILCLPCLAAADTEYCTISQVRKQAETLADGTIEIETLKGRYTVSLEIPDVEQIPVITIALPKPDQVPPVPEGGSIEERRSGNAGYMTGWSVQLKKEQVAGTPMRYHADQSIRIGCTGGWKSADHGRSHCLCGSGPESQRQQSGIPHASRLGQLPAVPGKRQEAICGSAG